MSSRWTNDDEISATVESVGLSNGVRAGQSDDVRFAQNVRDIVAGFVADAPLARPVVFLLLGPDEDPPAGAEYKPRIHKGEVDLAGGIWTVRAAAVSGHGTPIPGDASEEIFEAVCGALGLGDAPAMYCDTNVNPPVLAWYPEGLGTPDVLFEGPLGADIDPTLGDVIEIVDRVHRFKLMTSRNQKPGTTLWQDPDKHWAHEHAEKRAQEALMLGLDTQWPRPFFAEEEIRSDTGRYDIAFKKVLSPGVVETRAILELKVTRSRGHNGGPYADGRNAANTVMGVEQAKGYALDHGTRDAACLIFDLRTDEHHSPPDAAVARGAELDVAVHWWRCFPTSEDYRDIQLANL